VRRIIWDAAKIFVIFILCTVLFYYGLQLMRMEYEEYHRYDPPEGQSVKVFENESTFLERLPFLD